MQRPNMCAGPNNRLPSKSQIAERFSEIHTPPEDAIIPPGLLCGEYEIEVVRKSIHGILFYSGEQVKKIIRTGAHDQTRQDNAMNAHSIHAYDQSAYDKYLRSIVRQKYRAAPAPQSGDNGRTIMQQFLDLEASAEELPES